MRISGIDSEAVILNTGSDGSDHRAGLVNTDLMNTWKFLYPVLFKLQGTLTTNFKHLPNMTMVWLYRKAE